MVGMNNVPVIKAEDKTIKVGDKFNPLEGVTATDKEDEDLTKDIKVIENTVNPDKAGEYKVVYEVTDSQGAKATKTIIVKVVEEPSKPNDNNTTPVKPDNTSNSNSNSSSAKPGNTSNVNNSTSSENPQTGEIGILGSVGTGLAAIVGLFAIRKKKDEDNN